jgi:hypothetical protein
MLAPSTLTVIGVCQKRSVWPALEQAKPTLYCPAVNVFNARLSVAVPVICPVVTAVLRFTWGVPVVEYNGWAIDPAAAPIGSTGPDASHVNVPASTAAEAMYWFQRNPPVAVSPGQTLFGATSDNVNVVDSLPDVGDTV